MLSLEEDRMANALRAAFEAGWRAAAARLLDKTVRDELISDLQGRAFALERDRLVESLIRKMPSQ